MGYVLKAASNWMSPRWGVNRKLCIVMHTYMSTTSTDVPYIHPKKGYTLYIPTLPFHNMYDFLIFYTATGMKKSTYNHISIDSSNIDTKPWLLSNKPHCFESHYIESPLTGR